MQETFEVIRTDAETGEEEVVSLKYALELLATPDSNESDLHKALENGLTLQTRFASYKRCPQLVEGVLYEGRI